MILLVGNLGWAQLGHYFHFSLHHYAYMVSCQIDWGWLISEGLNLLHVISHPPGGYLSLVYMSARQHAKRTRRGTFQEACARPLQI